MFAVSIRKNILLNSFVIAFLKCIFNPVPWNDNEQSTVSARLLYLLRIVSLKLRVWPGTDKQVINLWWGCQMAFKGCKYAAGIILETAS